MDAQTMALHGPADLDAEAHEVLAAHHHRTGLAAFGGHFAEMVIAMMVGMMVVGMPLAALANVLFGPELIRIPEVRALGMAASMTLPMIGWMRYRGHSWSASIEMGATMILPTVALLPTYWAGLIAGGALLGLQHATMLPAMLIAMLYRRHEYGL